MKRALSIIFILVLSVWLGVYVQKDPGYILISYQKTTIETSLWVGLLALLLSFGVIYFIVRFFKQIGSVGDRWRRWRAYRRMKSAHSRTSRGLIEFSEGNWTEAEKYLIKALPSSDTPIINYLAAARAAQELGESKRRDQYLREAQRVMPDARIAIELTQAQLQMANGQYEQALATLRHLQSIVPKHKYVLKLLHHVYFQLKDWASLQDMMRLLRRYSVLSEDELLNTEFYLYRGLLEQACQKKDVEALQATWRGFPRHISRDTHLVLEYAKRLLEIGAGVIAEQVIKDQLKREWSDKLIELYGLAEGSDANKQLAMAEYWLKSRPNNPQLLLSAARLCLRNQLWGKAKTYLENSLSMAPRPDTYAELAQLLDRLGEHTQATQYYREGLALSSQRKITPPALEPPKTTA